MHLAILHDGLPALLRVEGPAQSPAVLFFHPFPLNADVWEEVLLACAAAGLRAAAVDAPGFGGTPPLGRPLEMEYLARLGAAALDALGAARAGIAGCSMGGYAALAFLSLFRERATSVALIATRAGADAPAAKEKREQQAQAALARGPRAVVDEMVPKLLAPQAPEGTRRRVETLAAAATAQGIADALRGMALRPDRSPELAQVKVPALVIAGEQDQLIPRADVEALARGIPGARLEAIAGAGHLPFLERPQQVVPLVTAHFASSAAR